MSFHVSRASLIHSLRHWEIQPDIELRLSWLIHAGLVAVNGSALRIPLPHSSLDYSHYALFTRLSCPHDSRQAQHSAFRFCTDRWQDKLNPLRGDSSVPSGLPHSSLRSIRIRFFGVQEILNSRFITLLHMKSKSVSITALVPLRNELEIKKGLLPSTMMAI